MNQFIISSNLVRLIGLPVLVGFSTYSIIETKPVPTKIQLVIVAISIFHFIGSLILLRGSSQHHWDFVSLHYPKGFVKFMAMKIHDYLLGFIQSWLCRILILLIGATGMSLMWDSLQLSVRNTTEFFISWKCCLGYIAGFWISIFASSVLSKPKFSEFKLYKKLKEILKSDKKYSLKPMPKTLRVFVPSLTYYFSQILRYLSVLFINLSILIHNHLSLRKMLFMLLPIAMCFDLLMDLYRWLWWNGYIGLNRLQKFISFVLAWTIFIGAIYYSFISIRENLSSPSIGNISASILVFIFSFIFFMGFRFYSLQCFNPLIKDQPPRS